MKAAVYSGTRNLYDDMIPAVKSLLMHSDVDKVFLLIEDDKFPHKLPKEVECINISGQKYFPPDGANMHTHFTYMSLIRVALPLLFPKLDTILALDVDTIVEQDISDLWDIPLGDEYYFAASREPEKSSQSRIYANIGVCLYNLKKLRKDGLPEKLIKELNEVEYELIDQECLNRACVGHIYDMPSEYNATRYTELTENPKIVHYAGTNVKFWREYPSVNKYRDVPYLEIERIRKNKTYKKVNHSTKYMIHACKDRMWYVNDYIIPSMLVQGIDRSNIKVWLDKDGIGNLESCMKSFSTLGKLGDGASGTWHLQDDIVISSKFRERTEKYDNGIVCGFCSVDIDGMATNYIWGVPIQHMWFSFPCIRIPDFYAWECADWYYKKVKKANLIPMYTQEGKHDDSVWRHFMTEYHSEAMVINMKPNIVNHVDYLIGGSLINSQRNGIRTALYWDEPELVEELKEKLSKK